MKIHNILEEQILSRVKTIYEDKDIQSAPWFHCGCEQCRLDTTAYVLNRMQPRYVVSERGIAHAVADQGDQLDADVDFLIIEGIKKISTVRRSFHGKTDLFEDDINDLESAYNFPIFHGALFDGESFEPVIKGTIILKLDNMPVEMIDETWSNPYPLHDSTNGAYAFWVKPIPSEVYDQEKVFNFQIEVISDDYNTTHYAFSLPITSEKHHSITPDTTYRFKIEDLHLFSGDEDE